MGTSLCHAIVQRMSIVLPALLSVVIVVRDEEARLRRLLSELCERLAAMAADYELVVVDNGSTDATAACLRELTGPAGLANLQAYCLTKEVDFDTAAWAGIESALGDYVAVFDPLREDPAFLPTMIEAATSGADVVFAENQDRSGGGVTYGLGSRIFHRVYRWLNGVDLSHDAPRFRLLSRRIVNFVMQHPVPSLSYRHFPATGGFRTVKLTYRAPPLGRSRTRLSDDVERGVRLIVSSTRAPMRLVTTLSLFGALSNVVYTGYVLAVAFLKDNVAPGWVTLSLQQSGMFFLISMVLMVLGEYIMHMAALSTAGPRYYVAQEFTSAVQTRRSKLNVEEPEPAVISWPARAKSGGASS
jgi:polyisoprenyl-phosphate glycosyltransferase